MQLKSTYQIYREVVGTTGDAPDQERHRDAEDAVVDYLDSIFVYLKNTGDIPFEGLIATYNGREYAIAPGEKRSVPLSAVVGFLGNWASTGKRRQLEHQLLKCRYGNFDSMAQEDIDRFIRDSAAITSALKNKKLLNPQVQKYLEAQANRLPTPAPLPSLEVLDIDTLEPLGIKWPLYDPDYEPPEDVELKPELRQIYDMLADKLQQEREIADREFVRRFEEEHGSIDDIEDDEDD